jgi:GT2 family glycosyltransferase
MRLSIIVPFHSNLEQLGRSLAALRRAGHALPEHAELAEIIVVADGSSEDPTALARENGARVLAIAGPQGPAVARNHGAASASGDLLVFVDTDVVVSASALAQFAALFTGRDAAAAFGAYDETPADPGFISTCRNLSHSFIHQRSNREAHTFWAGLGAVRRQIFAAVGGFDERLAKPSVEDIDLGYRIRTAGFRIRLDPRIQGTHLKRWTFRSSVVSDIRDRGVPWTQLLKRYDSMKSDLNITVAYRVCVVMAYLLVLCLAGAFRWPILLVPAAAAAAALCLLDFAYYRFFAQRLGLGSTIAWFPFHVLHHLCNGLSFILGTSLWIARRAGFALPGSLPLTSWPAAANSRTASPVESARQCSSDGGLPGVIGNAHRH